MTAAVDGFVQLASTGELVSTTSPAWRDECKVRHDHVQTLMSMRGQHLRQARQQYLATVQATEGEESARRLRAALTLAWEAAQRPADGAGG